MNAELRSTRNELRVLQDRMTTLQTELSERESALRFLSDPNVRYVSLGGLKPTPDASAWLLWDPGTRQGLLLACGLSRADGRASETTSTSCVTTSCSRRTLR